MLTTSVRAHSGQLVLINTHEKMSTYDFIDVRVTFASSQVFVACKINAGETFLFEIENLLGTSDALTMLIVLILAFVLVRGLKKYYVYY